MEVSSLKLVRRIAPEIRLGWSVPKVRRNYLAHPATRPIALLLVAYARRAFPRRLCAALRAGEVEAIMAHWALVTPAFWSAIRAAGGELYVWTVDDPAKIAEFERMGVTGIISNDPRLFA
jgi:glycerophosphoryl diester phosphodiesterase